MTDEQPLARRTRVPDRQAERRKRLAGDAPSRSRPAGPTRVLEGGFDAVSLPVQSEPGVDAFIGSERNDWLFPVGSGRSHGVEGVLPQRLSTPGWIFLRTDSGLAARVRFLGARRVQVRKEHIASEDGEFHDRGPGHILVVDRESWTRLEPPIPIGDREGGNGYRYYDVDADGSNPVFRTVE